MKSYREFLDEAKFGLGSPGSGKGDFHVVHKTSGHVLRKAKTREVAQKHLDALHNRGREHRNNMEIKDVSGDKKS